MGQNERSAIISYVEHLPQITLFVGPIPPLDKVNAENHRLSRIPNVMDHSSSKIIF